MTSMDLRTYAFVDLSFLKKKKLKIIFYVWLAIKTVVGRITAPKDVCVPLLGTCAYVTLYCGCMKLRTSRWLIILDELGC